MRYTFISLSIAAIWMAIIMLAVWTAIDTTFLILTALGVTVALFLIGFGGKTRR